MKSLSDYERENAAAVARWRELAAKERRARAKKVRAVVRKHTGVWSHPNDLRAFLRDLVKIVEEGRHG